MSLQQYPGFSLLPVQTQQQQPQQQQPMYSTPQLLQPQQQHFMGPSSDAIPFQSVPSLARFLQQAPVQPQSSGGSSDSFKTFLTSLLSTYLPNLESLELDKFCSYVPVLEALKSSRLRSLKKLSVPSHKAEKSELAAYRCCANLMKDRLENLLLADDVKSDSSNEVQISFNYLHSHLNDFCKLEEITIWKTTEKPAQFLDEIIENCPSLKDMEFILPSDVRKSTLIKDDNELADVISKEIPRNNRKYITTNTNIIFDQGLLLYMARRFPSLIIVPSLSPYSSSEPRTHSLTISQSQLEQLLPILNKFETISVNGYDVDYDILTKTIGDFWDNTLKPGSTTVIFTYAHPDEEGNCSLFDGMTEICYDRADFRDAHYPFLERNGKFVKEIFLCYSSLIIDQYMYTAREEIIAHTFENCPNIQILRIQNWKLKRITNDIPTTRSLDILQLSYCSVYAGALESLSTMLHEVNLLEISHMGYFRKRGDDPSENVTKIMLPHTKVKVLALWEFAFVDKGSRQVYCYSTAKRRSRYFKLVKEKKYAIPSSREDYKRAEKCLRIQICCENFPVVKSIF